MSTMRRWMGYPSTRSERSGCPSGFQKSDAKQGSSGNTGIFRDRSFMVVTADGDPAY